MKVAVVFEDQRLLAINKPAGLAVEPPSSGPTLLDWLVQEGRVDKKVWSTESRYGVVHRLDSDTSGILIWAKTPTEQTRLKELWQGRMVEKTYLALVSGQIDQSGTIELSLRRDNKKDRQVVDLLTTSKSRPAISHYRRLAISQRQGHVFSLVEVKPITGRTHQIRVHLKSIGHPIIGDQLYGEKVSRQLAKELGLSRQFLHAWTLKLPDYPEFSAQLPNDLKLVLDKLQLSDPTG